MFEDFPIGKSFEFGRYEVSASLLSSYAAAFDPRPDHPVPRESIEQATASPLQLCAILMRMNFDGWMRGTSARGAPGVDEVVLRQPVHAGDVLRCQVSVLQARVSQSKPELGLIQFRHDLMNSRSLVMTQTNFVMFGRRAHGEHGSEQRAQAKISTPSPAAPAATVAMPTTWTREALGKCVGLGTTTFSAESIIAFARVYDPQSFHVDEIAARTGPFGALAASGWHTASAWMRAFVDACHNNGAVPGRLVAIRDLRWLRPICAGDSITWDVTPLDLADDGSTTTLTSRNGGVNQHGDRVFDFLATTAIPQGGHV